ncbi:MAG TPA: sigma 54-interacting transcriptional regulator [Methylomirabilota bacterium]|nr:sigma 54-interacting transcriptional regulator [Methylomirabilota bacterium]
MGEDPRIVAAREKVRTIERMPPGTRPPPLLISGEPGTGKMSVASPFHHHIGPRRDRGMADGDWFGPGETHAEWMLFGNPAGYFHSMPRGTVLINWIERVPARLQTRLLETVWDPTLAWMIATTEVDLALEVRAGRFNRTLEEVLGASSIRLPPLRERGLDVILLAEYILASWCIDNGLKPGALHLLPDAIDSLLRHPWPGNVGELEHVVWKAAFVARQGGIRAADLSLPPGNVGM